ncbi:alpha/beta fold hydrolase [Nocardioides humi]|uniref:Alpha/beta fold hydrolase n=1 Tax=Nocardioides humi TaxID=449461 RepID=A0ABN2A5V9_9ACTN|nr:alpha/beta fold hydrolase [Nocardioides humi]
MNSTTHLVRGQDLSLQVTEVGQGEPIVWLHGSGPGATGMSNFGGNLPAFDGYRHLVFDLPRYGGSDRVTIDEPLVPFAARNVVAVLEAMAVERFHVVGNSFGGSVGIKIAADHPDRVRRLVVNAGGARPQDASGRSPGLALLWGYMEKQQPTRDDMAEFIDAMVVDKSLVTDRLVDERYEASLRTHPELETLPPVFGDLLPDLPRVEAPTLLLWGREDVFLPIERALVNVRGIPNAELRVIPGCGHWVQVEAREYFDAAVRRFLDEAAP